MNNFNTTINELQEVLGEITGNFYQRNNTIGYQKLIPMIDTLTSFVDNISAIDLTPELTDKKDKLTFVLNTALEAMINKDTILLADVLKYDLSELLEEIQNIMND